MGVELRLWRDLLFVKLTISPRENVKKKEKIAAQEVGSYFEGQGPFA